MCNESIVGFHRKFIRSAQAKTRWVRRRSWRGGQMKEGVREREKKRELNEI